MKGLFVCAATRKQRTSRAPRRYCREGSMPSYTKSRGKDVRSQITQLVDLSATPVSKPLRLICKRFSACKRETALERRNNTPKVRRRLAWRCSEGASAGQEQRRRPAGDECAHREARPASMVNHRRPAGEGEQGHEPRPRWQEEREGGGRRGSWRITFHTLSAAKTSQLCSTRWS